MRNHALYKICSNHLTTVQNRIRFFRFYPKFFQFFKLPKSPLCAPSQSSMSLPARCQYSSLEFCDTPWGKNVTNPIESINQYSHLPASTSKYFFRNTKDETRWSKRRNMLQASSESRCNQAATVSLMTLLVYPRDKFQFSRNTLSRHIEKHIAVSPGERCGHLAETTASTQRPTESISQRPFVCTLKNTLKVFALQPREHISSKHLHTTPETMTWVVYKPLQFVLPEPVVSDSKRYPLEI